MLGQLIFFFAGIVLMLVIFIPVLRYHKKRIRDMETNAAQSEAGISEFREKITKLAAAVKYSAGFLFTSEGISGGVDMDKIENSIDENAQIVAGIADKTSSVSAIASKTEGAVLKGFSVLEKNVKKMGVIKEKNS